MKSGARSLSLHSLALGLLVALLVPSLAVAQPGIEPVGFHVFGTGNNGGPFGVVNLCPNQRSPYIHWDLREFPSCGVPYEINGTIPLQNGITFQPIALPRTPPRTTQLAIVLEKRKTNGALKIQLREWQSGSRLKGGSIKKKTKQK